jgi:Sec-independent protein secretion pathway component TatC
MAIPFVLSATYFNLFFTLMVALGVVFQMPAVMFVLARIGLVNAPS